MRDNEHARHVAEMEQAWQVLIQAGMIVAAGLILVVVLLGAAGFWAPIDPVR